MKKLVIRLESILVQKTQLMAIIGMDEVEYVKLFLFEIFLADSETETYRAV